MVQIQSKTSSLHKFGKERVKHFIQSAALSSMILTLLNTTLHAEQLFGASILRLLVGCEFKSRQEPPALFLSKKLYPHCFVLAGPETKI